MVNWELENTFYVIQKRQKILEGINICSVNLLVIITDYTAGHIGFIRCIFQGIDNYFSYRITIYKTTTDSQIMGYLKSSEFIEQIRLH
ncbi:13541_t:CDS:2 [Entrophospora sp. SA101]|nr:13541_t:CDS:2 [Entrophospora sp. SA101]